MAVDSRDKRMSLILLDLPYGHVYPNPDGTIGALDRQHWLGKYSGIAFGATATILKDLTTILMKYLPTLRAAAVTALIDSTSELTRQIRTWRNADTFTDTPTVIARALS